MVSLLLVADINQVDKRGQEREYVLGIATLGPEERPILSQRDEGWAEEWLYFHQPTSQPTDRLSSKIFKMEYFRNRLLDRPKILNISLWDHTKIENCLK